MIKLEGETRPTTVVDREPIPVMFSVGVLLTVGEDALVLVQNRETGLWGLPAGHLRAGKQDGLYVTLEDPREAALRETVEETGLPPGQIITSPSCGQLFKPRSGGVSIGYIFEFSVKERSGVAKPYQSESPEISLVRMFNRKEVADELLLHPEKVRVPEFNLRLLRYWVADSLISRYEGTEGQDFGFQLLIQGYSDVVNYKDLDLFGVRRGEELLRRYQESCGSRQ
ncbi:NUDIX hydrolase [Patescibacteria group bacterium]|nr:NUDIX hydrolase [Patescibacteria group bacterium]